MESPESTIAELVVQSCFVSIEYDDYWRLRTDRGIWVLGHSLRVSTETDIEAALRARIPEALETVDRGVVPTAAGLFALLRRPIESVSIDHSGLLSIRVGGAYVRAEVDAEHVDWQWSVSRTRETPYTYFDVACFERGNVRESRSPE